MRYGRIWTALFAGLCNCFISLGLSYLFFGTMPPLGDSILVYLKAPITVDILLARYYAYGIKILSYFSGLLYGFLAVCLYLQKKWCSWFLIETRPHIKSQIIIKPKSNRKKLVKREKAFIRGFPLKSRVKKFVFWFKSGKTLSSNKKGLPFIEEVLFLFHFIISSIKKEPLKALFSSKES